MRRYLLFISLLLVLCTANSEAQLLENLKEINPAGNSYPYGFTAVGNNLFFVAGDNVNYNKLWVSDGTTANTIMLGPATGAINSFYNLFAYKNRLYFSFNDGVNGQELWVSDGTVAGTTLFKDIYPGSTGSFPQAFTITNNKLFFTAGNVDGEKRLYVTDGTPGGTLVVKNNYVDIFNGYTDFAVLNNDIYFRSDNGTGSGYGLWKSDGTPGGAVLLKPDIVPGTLGGNFAVLNNKIYFSVFDYTNGSELWVSDGSDPGTYMVKNIYPDNGGILSSGAPNHLVVYNSKLYFNAVDPTRGAELFESDGTASGTQLVKDIFPGTTGSNPENITVFKGLMYFTCATTGDLWQSDGTTAGTQQVKVLLPYSRIAGNFNGKLYFTNNFDYLLWESDGTTAGTGPMKVQNTVNPIYGYGADIKFTNFKTGMYFSGYCYQVTAGYEPCKLSSGAAPVTSFTFTGSGNWSNPANWSGGNVPPSPLPTGSSILITGNCILDVTQIVQSGASITVATGATLVIPGSLTLL